jgi:NAD(P)-dependent dehydrogenase (short-subunit alcohol dehydrogenase family)
MSRITPRKSAAAPFDINGRTVFITGAARGIGAETARRLHGKGANVALVGLEPERLEELAAQLGDRAAFFEVDVTDYDALQRAVRATVERFGALDVAIANAGVSSMVRWRPRRSSRLSASCRSTCSAYGAPTAP